MKVLVIGGGGREHAMIWKLSQSPMVDKLYCAPGNAGIADLAECVNIGVMDIEGVKDFCLTNNIDMAVVAPDDPLAAGMVNELEAAGIKAFGPNKEAAIIEASKAFSKDLMKKYGIPTAAYEVFADQEKAIEYLKSTSYPTVVKADGLALGKGVIIAQDFDEAKQAVCDMMENKSFGESGTTVVIEEFMTGQEISILAFTDGKTVVPMVSSQDHKRAFDHDEGLNTGGMGTFSPSRIYTKELDKECMEKIFIPTIEAMNKEGRTFKGVLYFGLMKTPTGIKVLEYNARFGDPETQVVLPRLKSDLCEIFLAVIEGRLADVNVEWYDNAAVCVVLASGGYPLSYKKGYEIHGLENYKHDAQHIIFHAGTKSENGATVTNGGRVLGLTALAPNLDAAIKEAYSMTKKVSFEKMHFRTDIGVK